MNICHIFYKYCYVILGKLHPFFFLRFSSLFFVSVPYCLAVCCRPHSISRLTCVPIILYSQPSSTILVILFYSFLCEFDSTQLGGRHNHHHHHTRQGHGCNAIPPSHGNNIILIMARSICKRQMDGCPGNKLLFNGNGNKNGNDEGDDNNQGVANGQGLGGIWLIKVLEFLTAREVFFSGNFIVIFKLI